MSNNKLAIVILAAGKGKRMNNPNLPKVLVELKERPLLDYVLELSANLNPEKVVVIVGYHKEQVIEFIKKHNKPIFEYAIQEEQLGTGHAVAQTESNLSEFDGNILILSGDVPLLSKSTTQNFIHLHYDSNSSASVLSSIAQNPYGYGRIIRDENDDFIKITEEKDANEQEKSIKEINSGIYMINSKLLFESLKKISNNNAQNEYYLTDVIDILYKQNHTVKAFAIADFNEIQGVNHLTDLENLQNNLS